MIMPTILDLYKQISSTLMEILKVLLLLLFYTTESFIILQNLEPMFHIIPLSILLIYVISLANISKTSPVYVVDFTCFKPPNCLRVPFSSYIEHARMLDFFDDKSVSFISKILQLSGMGDQTYFPPGLFYIPPKSGHKKLSMKFTWSFSPSSKISCPKQTFLLRILTYLLLTAVAFAQILLFLPLLLTNMR